MKELMISASTEGMVLLFVAPSNSLRYKLLNGRFQEIIDWALNLLQ
jgi:hypothetical protein